LVNSPPRQSTDRTVPAKIEDPFNLAVKERDLGQASTDPFDPLFPSRKIFVS
jgi:hypothetical protein